MSKVSASIEADVPIEFADREWREFVRRSLYGRATGGRDDMASSIDELDADDGTVSFETEPNRLVRVSVELDYVPRSSKRGEDEARRAQEILDSDLQKYRSFVLRRCAELDCRTN